MTRIVTVCTGNICRSPAAQLLLAAGLGPDAVVTSAGTHAMTGHGIPASMLICLDEDGIEGRGHRATQFDTEVARSADLVITMTSQHRTHCVSQAPFALRRTFMLEEIAEAARRGAPLAGVTPAERLAGVAQAVADFRPELAGVALRDVPDPYQRSQDNYDEAYRMIRESIGQIITWVRG